MRTAWIATALLASCSARPTAPTPANVPARAYQIDRPEQLLRGPTAVGRLGDYRMDNGRIAVVINAPENVLGFAVSGGNLVDAGHLDAHGNAFDDLRQLFVFLNDNFPQQGRFDRLEIVMAEGDQAVIVAHGSDSFHPKLTLRHEYRLARGANHLLLRTTVHNGTGAPIASYELGDIIQWGLCTRFMPDRGFVRGRLRSPWLAGVGDHVTYGYTAANGELEGPHGTSWSDPIIQTVDLAPDQTVTYERYLIIGDHHGVASIAGTVHQLRGEAHTLHTVQVIDTAGKPISSATVSVRRAAGTVAVTGLTGADGRVQLPVPAGDHTVSASAAGRAASPWVPLLAADSPPQTVPLPPPAVLRVQVTGRSAEGTLAPIPVKLTLVGTGATPTPALGPRHRATGAGNVVVTATGAAAIPVGAGTYRLYASRGLEWTLAQQQVTVEPGRPTDVELTLQQVVDTTGYLSGDFHQHALPSGDSAVALEDRITADLAEGVEILVSTDHNTLTDYAPVLAAMKVPSALFTLIGVEATSETEGHYNAYPLTPRSDQARGGAPLVEKLAPGDIFSALRELGEDVVVQVNHPRAAGIGYFRLIGFEPGDESPPKSLSLNFDAFELMNGKRLASVPDLLKDWYWLLDRGHRVTAMGNSDSHAIIGSEAGYPRTYLGMGTDDPRQATATAVVAQIKQRRDVLVTNGPFITVRDTDGNSVIGRTLADGQVEITVQAAPWIDVTELEIIANGVPMGPPIPVSAPAGAVVRYRATVQLPVVSDGWYIVIARGNRELLPVVPGATPLAITNPIWTNPQ